MRLALRRACEHALGRAYLTEEEKEALEELVERCGVGKRMRFLNHARGMWADRGDLEDVRVLRREWDRGSHGDDG